MTLYADPRRCPDCGCAIVPGAPACPTCALSLTGETAQRLFATLSKADTLLAALRAASVPTPATAAPATVPAAPFAPETPRVRRPRTGLSAASVPKVLLALGAGCLLVAALVFLAVTWSVLGVGGRTATLVALTGIAGGIAAAMARRGLRGTAEALALVGYGLLSLDVLGADHAGWFGDLSSAGLLVLLGLVLAVAGGAGALGVRRTAAGTLTVAEIVVATGAALMSFGTGVADWLPVSASLLAATLVGVGVTAVASRLGMPVATVGSATVAGAAWVCLTAQALDRALAHPTWRALWLGLEVWPLLAAAALLGGLVAVRRLPESARVAAVGLAELLVVVAVVVPVLDAGPTTLTVVAIGVLVVVGAAGRALPRPWGLSSLATQVVASGLVLTVVVHQSTLAVQRLLAGSDPAWSGVPADRLPSLAGTDVPAPWLLPIAVFALLATLAVIADASAMVDRTVSRVPGLQAAVVALLAGSAVGALALYPVALWLVVGALLLVAAACTVWWLVGGSVSPLVPAGAFLGAGLLVSLPAAPLTAAALLVALAVTLLVHLRSRSTSLSAAGGALVAAALGGAVWTAGHLLHAEPVWVALAGLVVLGVLALGAPYAPDRWWVSGEPTLCRRGLEAGAAAAAVPLALAGVLLAPADVATWAAVYLTTAGVLVSVMSLVRADRRMLGWAGGVLLALASWVRLWDIGVHAPEAYTLPSAVALVVVGVLHLRRTPGASTMSALSPGLSLALVPSLLWALSEPTGPRPLLLGLACLALVLAGLRTHWSAPVAFGATVGALLVVRLAAPYVGDAVPRWVLIGLAGTLLIGVGATWERRLTEARQLMGYVRGLR